MLQEKCLRIVSPMSPARPYCCYAVIIVLIVAVIALSVALSLSVRKEKMAIANLTHGNTTCPEDWIEFGSKCFYNFLNGNYGHLAPWIGLHRESSEQPWMWTDNTEYNNLVPIRGDGNHAYLSDRGISSGRDYIYRSWICSKPKSYT
ncbi:hypothetical protein U0070_002897, partial [Myodes glareolus]